jgi:hypothetical protein
MEHAIASPIAKGDFHGLAGYPFMGSEQIQTGYK